MEIKHEPLPELILGLIYGGKITLTTTLPAAEKDKDTPQ